MLTGLENSEACFLYGIKAFFIEHRRYNDLRHATEGGSNAAAYLYAILLYRDNGGAAADDAAKVHMRGRGQRQYDVVEMAEQRGVSAFAREGHACAPLLDLAHLG
jgi:hypothetical protein